ncbi:hypothetical protein [Hoeflea sp.]|uniref:hypothetical protein n=1 Tax=Hoeflea sp. TaxID=1940281 RepID=UPI003B526057
MAKVTHLRFDGERYAATKLPPMSRAGIALLLALALALASATAHGIAKALQAAEHQYQISRV